MTDSWYNEVNVHDFARDFQAKSGHFTQLVWKNSKQIGFGIAESKKGNVYAVAQYYPAGNVIKQFRRNVKKADYENDDYEDNDEDNEVFDEDYDEEYEDYTDVGDDKEKDRIKADKVNKNKKEAEKDRKEAENDRKEAKKDRKEAEKDRL